MLICHKSKIVIPSTLLRRIVEWYHEILCHTIMTRTEEKTRHHFLWLNLRKDDQTICETCDVCQRTKRINIKYGHLPEKVAESNPWDILCVDIIGPYGEKIINLMVCYHD
jgi:Integrase zinc binding domain